MGGASSSRRHSQRSQQRRHYPASLTSGFSGHTHNHSQGLSANAGGSREDSVSEKSAWRDNISACSSLQGAAAAGHSVGATMVGPDGKVVRKRKNPNYSSIVGIKKKVMKQYSKDVQATYGKKYQLNYMCNRNSVCKP